MSGEVGVRFVFGPYELDDERFELRCEGELVRLEPQVFQVLAYLVNHRDRLVAKEEIVEHVWPGSFISDAALNSRVMSARKAIGDSGREQRFIRTVHGRGYRFVAPVQTPLGEAGRTVPGRRVSAERQQVRFCRTPDGVQLAYATLGSGPPLVKAANWLTHLEHDLDSPVWGHLWRELATRRTLIRYDTRGCGLSDRNVEEISFDAWLSDLEALVDHLQLDRFPLLGVSQGSAVAIAYAAKHPERVSHLLLHGGYSVGWGARDASEEDTMAREALVLLVPAGWGREDMPFRETFAALFVPGMEPGALKWLSDLQRHSASPQMAVRYLRVFQHIDVRALLAKIRVPTLVTHSVGDQLVPFSEGRSLAASIPGALMIPLESRNHLLLEDEPAWQTFRSGVWDFLGRDEDSETRR